MKTELCEAAQETVTRFGWLVKGFVDQVTQAPSAVSVCLLEEQVRERGRQVLCSLLRHLLQTVIDPAWSGCGPAPTVAGDDGTMACLRIGWAVRWGR